MNAMILLWVLLAILDAGLWVAGVVMPLGETGRYRVLAIASILLVVLAGFILGWGWTLSLAAVMLWIAEILVANTPTSRSQGA